MVLAPAGGGAGLIESMPNPVGFAIGATNELAARAAHSAVRHSVINTPFVGVFTIKLA